MIILKEDDFNHYHLRKRLDAFISLEKYKYTLTKNISANLNSSELNAIFKLIREQFEKLNGTLLYCDSTYTSSDIIKRQALLYGIDNLCCTVLLSRDSVFLEFISDVPLEISGKVKVVIDSLTIIVSDNKIKNFDNGSILANIWYGGRHGYQASQKFIKTPQWNEIRNNYPFVNSNIDKLAQLESPYDHGKIVLMHGTPGTGKTWAIRALMRAWKKMDINVITDAERFFNDVEAIHSVILSNGSPVIATESEDSDDVVTKGKLIIIEDAGDFISESAQLTNSNARSRLLNLTDGLIGDGLEIVLLISTNLEFDKIDPAVARHGRCLAELKFEKFNPELANKWLGVNDIDEEKSLAELFHIKNKLVDIRSLSYSGGMGFK